jgi:hypothetical protein
LRVFAKKIFRAARKACEKTAITGGEYPVETAFKPRNLGFSLGQRARFPQVFGDFSQRSRPRCERLALFERRGLQAPKSAYSMLISGVLGAKARVLLEISARKEIAAPSACGKPVGNDVGF